MAVLWMLLAGFLFACMGVLVKLGRSHFSSDEIVFYRSVFGWLIMLAVVKQQRVPLTTSHWRSHFLRGLSGTVAMLLFFYCITVLPLATAVTLNYTSSLFLAALTVMVYKDHFHLPLSASLAMGFGGVILLLHPVLERSQLIDGLLGLASGFLAGFALLNVRQLGRLGEPPIRVVYYFNLVAMLLGGAWMLRGEVHPLGWGDLPLLIATGAAATFAQLAMTQAYRIGHTLVVSTFSYSTIAFASFFGLLFWGETLTPGGWLGISLIICSSVLSLKLSPKH